MKRLRTAIIGQGRSGRNIHGKFFLSEGNTYVDVVAVVDWDPARRELALQEYPGCEVYADYRDLFQREDLDLVVNSTFSDLHYSVTKDLLEHGLNVIVEKPMARSYYECSDLIRTAKEHGVMLAVFQQSMLAPYFTNAKDAIRSGKMGEILQIDITFSGFSRRWDWQSTQCRLGGNLYNTGPHPVSFALDLLDFDPRTELVYSKLARAQASGDADDYAKLILTAPGKPVVDLEVSSVDAFGGPTLKVQGTRGTLIMNPDRSYTMKYVVPGENPERPLIMEPLKDEQGLPVYHSEKLQFHEETMENPRHPWDESARRFYERIYNHLTAGVSLPVTAEHVAQIIRIIETAHAQNPLPVWCKKEDPHV
ncbi:MAG: Gfo/Idh/MocA family oxidoreductase [Oscillospiraceae bacterium]|nr:Gfo/Idh/MocA family oxidoreductase [Oscillospiraceae bacterium]